jgi:hypothetical protein
MNKPIPVGAPIGNGLLVVCITNKIVSHCSIETRLNFFEFYDNDFPVEIRLFGFFRCDVK